jgi:hypothetical protein
MADIQSFGEKLINNLEKVIVGKRPHFGHLPVRTRSRELHANVNRAARFPPVQHIPPSSTTESVTG